MKKIFKAIKKAFMDWRNSSDCLPADWLRRKHYEKQMNRIRKAG